MSKDCIFKPPKTEKIVGIVSWRDKIFVACSHSVWEIYQDGVMFRNKKLHFTEALEGVK